MKKEELERKVDEFVSKYNGKQKGYPTDSSYSGQCLSIVKLYMKEVFGFDPPPSGCNAAYCYWSKFPEPLSTYFRKIDNTPLGVPFKGCVPIWDTNTGGGYGHIDIFLYGGVNTFTGFDQNWNGMQSHLQEHNYSNIVGWLEPLLQENEQLLVITDQTKIPQIDNMEVQAIRSTLNDQKNQIEALNRVILQQEKTCKSELFENEKYWQNQLESANGTIEQLKKEKASEMSWQTLLSLALEKMFGKARG